jgi:hypothetical protein
MRYYSLRVQQNTTHRENSEIPDLPIEVGIEPGRLDISVDRWLYISVCVVLMIAALVIYKKLGKPERKHDVEGTDLELVERETVV